MSRKLQGLLDELRRSPLFPLYGFFLVFLAFKAVLLSFLQLGMGAMGYSPLTIKQVANNNEIFVQTLGLLLALWAVFVARQSQNSRKGRLVDFLGEALWVGLGPRTWLAEALNPVLRGFGIVSLGVLLLLLSGFLALEGQLNMATFYVLPLIVLRALSLALWVGVLELARIKLVRVLTGMGVTEVLGHLALVAFEGYLLFAVLATEASASETVFMTLVAVWWAALHHAWALLSGASLLSSWRRVCTVSSMLISLTCVYGFPVSWGRAASLTSVYEGSHPWARQLIESPSVLGQWSFILLFTGLSVVLVRKVLTQKQQPVLG